MPRTTRSPGRATIAIVGVASLLLTACGPSGSAVPSTVASATPASSEADASDAPFVGALDDLDGWVVDDIGTPAGGTVIRLTRTNGSDRHQVELGGDAFYQGRPEWLPDGSGFTYLTAPNQDLARSIHRFDLASGTSQVVVECVDPCLDATEQAVSPDGSRIAWAFVDGPLEDVQIDGEIIPIPAHCGLHVRTVAAGATSELTSSPCGIVEERFPRWSPSADRLAFVRTHSATRGGPVDASEVVVRDVATGDETVAHRIERAIPEDIDWMPDGRSIVYAIGDEVVSIDSVDGPSPPDGGARHLVVGPTQADRTAHHPRVTSDGRWIAFFRTEYAAGTMTRGSLWVVPTDGGEAQLVWPLAPVGPSALHSLYGSLQPSQGFPG